MNSDNLSVDQECKLLEQAQEYLRSRLEQQAPDTLLSAAWEEFYRVYSDLIRRFVIASGVRGTDVDDCVQEVWTEVSVRLVDFEQSPNRPGLRAWFYMVVRSKAMNLFRRTTRRPTLALAEAIATGLEPVGAEPDPADRYEARWEAAIAQTLLHQLREEVSELNYRVVHLRLVEAHDVPDVAAELEITCEQVRYRLHRMLKKLRARAAFYTGRPIGTGD